MEFDKKKSDFNNIPAFNRQVRRTKLKVTFNRRLTQLG